MQYAGAAKLTFKLGYDFLRKEWVVTLGDKVTSLSKLGQALAKPALDGAVPFEGVEALEAATGTGMATLFAVAALAGVLGFAIGSDGKRKAEEQTRKAEDGEKKAQE